MGGRNPSGFLHGSRPRSSSGWYVGNRLIWGHAHWGYPPPVSPLGVRRSSTRARKPCKNHRSRATTAHSPVYAKHWAQRRWQWSCCTQRADGSTRTALDGPGGRDDEPGPLALHTQAVWPGARLPRVGPAARRGPLGPGADDAWVDHIRRILATSPFPGEGYRKVWARLRHKGLRTSPRRVLRLRRAQQLRAPTRQGHPHGPKAQDGTIIPTQVDMMWGTDRTATCTQQEGQVAILIAVDHDSAECVGIHAAKQGPRCAAWEPIRQGVCNRWC
jgi:HTH-like domain